ncbi:MAG: Gfo/Idh/MocA family oxidoreductase [Reichenbachiella sp.]|uniref:Gfo/Idh/MocA family protein n=1 Tax=Reichenbachiella sp. TaxID=2184521 RepID=UPI003263B993
MVKTAVIGCGNIGKRHIAVFDNNTNTELAGVYDSSSQAAQAQVDTYQNRFERFDSMESVLKNSSLDLISICTPHHLHKEQTIAALEAGKHVLVEKPMALKTSDAKKMIEVAKAENRRLYVMKQNRFNVPIELTRDALNSGKLGKIYMVECNVYWNRNPEYYSNSDWRGHRQSEGGALFTQASHFIDLLVWWFGDMTEARALVDTKMQNIEIEDCGNAAIAFESGVQGNLTWTTCVYNKNYEGSITIIGEKGTVKIGGPYLNQIDYWDVQSYPLPTNINFADLPNNYGKYQGTSSNHHKVVAEIVKDLNGEKCDIVEGTEGIRSIDAIEKIYNSAGYKY